MFFSYKYIPYTFKKLTGLPITTIFFLTKSVATHGCNIGFTRPLAVHKGPEDLYWKLLKSH